MASLASKFDVDVMVEMLKKSREREQKAINDRFDLLIEKIKLSEYELMLRLNKAGITIDVANLLCLLNFALQQLQPRGYPPDLLLAMAVELMVPKEKA
jgi:hypothetical protein